MTPEQARQLDELTKFMKALKSSTTIPYDVDGAFRKRFITDIDLSTFGIPNGITNAPRSAVTAPIGGATEDAEARTAINSVISRLEELGLITEN